MTILDHILRFSDEPAARAALPDYCSQDDDGNWCWHGREHSSVIGPRENFRGIVADAVWDNSDPENPVLVTPEQVLDGFWLGIATTDGAESEALRALPGDACRIVLDRGASSPGHWSVVWISPAVDPSDIGPIRFEPVYLGSMY